jgi:inositol phosphorylceramide synthase catalytic subunit
MEMPSAETTAQPEPTSARGIRRRLGAWPAWWRSLTSAGKLGPALFVLLYWLALHALDGFRGDHRTIGAVILLLYYAGPLLLPLWRFLLPVLATGIVYDSQRFYSDYLRGPVHVDLPYLFEKIFFGIPTAQGRLTPNEWWQLHTHPALDLVTGAAYLVFVAVFILTTAAFVFHYSRKGTRKMAAAEIARISPRIMWGFFWLNVLGYSTYYWFAAAPPWYVTLYGLGPADMSALPNPAGCLRFDQLLGTRFFTEMYGRSADVFGAIPSLHVAYPLLAVYYALRFGALRAFSIGFYLLMCFSAVYLNHHYVVDVLWGSAYALLVAAAMDTYYDRAGRAAAA